MWFSCNIRFWHRYLHWSGFISPQGYQTQQGRITCAPSYFTFHISKCTAEPEEKQMAISILQDQKSVWHWANNHMSSGAKLRTFPMGSWGGEWSTTGHTENSLKGLAMSPIHVLKAWNATSSPTLHSEVVGGRTLLGECDSRKDYCHSHPDVALPQHTLVLRVKNT